MASTSDDEMAYLAPSFDPSTLTMPRLRAIFVSHDIPYPATANKAKLVDIFHQELVPRSRKILAARSRMKRTSKGITDVPSSQEGTVHGDDGDDGNDENASLMPPPAVSDTRRRPTRKSPRASSGDGTAEVPSGEPVSERKGSSKHPRTSDGEGGPDAEKKRLLVRKTRKSEVMPTMTIEEPDEPRPSRPSLAESAFSHENPFQSKSSPLTISENRRTSAGLTTDRRKSSSRRRRTDGAMSTESSTTKQKDRIVVPSSKTFEVPVVKTRPRKAPAELSEEAVETVEAGEEFTPEELLELVRERAANGEADILPPRRKERVQQPSGVSRSVPWVIIMTLLSGYAAWWRNEKIRVGYCGLAQPSTTFANVEIPDWATILQPDCETCPQHAYCYANYEARCEPDFVLRSHPLSLGGLIPLPVICEPDGDKARKVKAVADKAVEELRERRAKWECGGLTDEDGAAASSVDVDEKALKADVTQKRRKGMSDAEFEDLWKGAIGEIVGRDEVASTIDENTQRYRLSSSSLARLPLGCQLRRSARLTVARFRVEIASFMILSLLVALLRNYIVRLGNDRARVPLLVATTLDRLATQAALHDRGSSPEPWVSIGQLRDDVLRDEFSIRRREAIWQRVRLVVEKNANVQASVREMRAGDSSEVWEWVGSFPVLDEAWSSDRRESGRYSGGPVSQYEGRTGFEPADNREVLQTRHWDEGRPIY